MKKLIFSIVLSISCYVVSSQTVQIPDLVSSEKTYSNPIIPGFNPDPSICRVGDDFYLVTSTFEFFPGVPVYHSTDLVNWSIIGHCLSQPSQLNLDNAECSGGIYAPTIRYYKGTFYMITTLVGRKDGDFIVTAKNPAGPWSEPHWIQNAPGIDPSLFFDDDGKVYMSGNEHFQVKPGLLGSNIWIRELDTINWKLIGDKGYLVKYENIYQKGSPIDRNNTSYLTAIEGAHLYKKNGIYYVNFSHGGTGTNHAVSFLKSKNIFGPYTENPGNPIITHRDLPLTYPITSTGHADIFDTKNGDWWLVYLGKRTIQDGREPLGRETFLSPVDWSGEWPIVNPARKIGRAELVQMKPLNLKKSKNDNNLLKDNFRSETLNPHWTFIRTPRTTWWSLTDRKDFLRIQLRPIKITEKASPSYIGRRIEDLKFSTIAKMEFNPVTDNEEAGLLILRDRFYNLRLTLKTENGKKMLQIVLNNGKNTVDSVLSKMEVKTGNLQLKVSGKGLIYSFSYSTNGTDWISVKDNIDCVSNNFVKGGVFTGTFVGMYASSNGNETKSYADFDWFDYRKE